MNWDGKEMVEQETDLEWLILILAAKRSGLTIEDVRGAFSDVGRSTGIVEYS